MFYVYLVLSAALIPFLDNFFEILRHTYSWWLVPLLFVGFFVVFVVLHMAVFAISVLLTSLNSPPERGTNYFRFMTNSSIKMLMKIFRIKINVTGLDKVPESDKRMMFVCNHQHDLDPLMMMSIFPDYDLGFIGKKEIYENSPISGKIMHKLFCLPIDRENDRAAVKTIIEAINILKSGKASIGLFPEGYTSKTRELLPFRNGAFKIAYKANAPIVVCVINNAYSIFKNIPFHHTTLEFRVLEVLMPEDYKEMSTVELGDKLHLKMKDALAEIRK